MAKQVALPDKVRIIDRVFSVKYYDNPYEVGEGDGLLYNGQIDNNYSVIRILSKHKEDERNHEDIASDMLHEILHGIAMSFDIGELDGEDSQENEKNINRLTHCIHAILQDNPGLVNLLMYKNA